MKPLVRTIKTIETLKNTKKTIKNATSIRRRNAKHNLVENLMKHNYIYRNN